MFLMHLRFLGSMNHKLNIAKAGNGQLRVHKPGLDWQNVNFVLSENAWTYITLTLFFFYLLKLFTYYSCLHTIQQGGGGTFTQGISFPFYHFFILHCFLGSIKTGGLFGL